ncbi:MAG: NTP transferase domain-containing protein [Lachnospiraceae bacterium]|nr:NTP transferase domain-containing protein [Lachnospiraceae bacterium]
MNKQESDILNAMYIEKYTNQRALAELTGHSLGVVNRCIKSLTENGYIDDKMMLTLKAYEEFRANTPKNAIILAAGYGMRMVPINTEVPKGLLEVDGEPLIERTIKYLKEVGVHQIYIVVGYMKEHYEYLIDEYGVELVVCEEYAQKNNLHSIKLVTDKISNSYIIPCDIWCGVNPFSKSELYSWYMVTDMLDKGSNVRVNRKMELAMTGTGEGGNAMIGIAYIKEEQAEDLRNKINEMCQNPFYDNVFWEEALVEKDRMTVLAKVVSGESIVEINTYEQLRELDSGSNHLKTEAMNIISDTLQVKEEQIVDINLLKKGMTNRSFIFRCKDKKYIMRIPGEGTSKLINRREEAAVYNVIKDKNICDDIIYINPENGYKITEFLPDARNCDPLDAEDVKKCMKRLREFHEQKLKVNHRFDIFGQIDFYESLWEGKPSVYRDYKTTKEHVLELKAYIEKYKCEEVLTHIDAVPDNFVFVKDAAGNEEIRLIDWEYAGMQDPHVDIAMFCIYSMYNKEQVDALIDAYFPEGCSHEIRIKIYCYIAACGLLWSNWCEYKRELGIEFGEYSLRQYRFAKDYYRIVKDMGGLIRW